MISRRWPKITLRWSFITSSNFKSCLRMSKLRPSTFACAAPATCSPTGGRSLRLLSCPASSRTLSRRSDPKDPHQVIFKRQEERRTARVTLTSRAATQLVIDTAALVTLSRENIKTTSLMTFSFSSATLSFDPCRNASGSASGSAANASWTLSSTLPPN